MIEGRKMRIILTIELLTIFEHFLYWCFPC